MKRALTLFGIVLALASTANAFQQEDFKGFSSLASSTWKNQRGSTMMINVDSFGNVTGQYVNAAPDTGCQGSPYPLVGRITGNFIAFSVAWNNATENCNSTTGWAGYAQANGGTIEIITNWNLAYQGTSPTIEQGSDTFTYVAQANAASFRKK